MRFAVTVRFAHAITGSVPLSDIWTAVLDGLAGTIPVSAFAVTYISLRCHRLVLRAAVSFCNLPLAAYAL